MSADTLLETDATQLVATFAIAGTTCGIDAMKVQEVVRVGDVTVVHEAPPHITGVINLRGKIVTVIDLGVALGMSPVAITPQSRVFIIEWGGEHIGLLTDRAGDVVAVCNERTTSPPANIRGVQGRFFESVFRTDEQLIAILNVDAVLQEQAGER